MKMGGGGLGNCESFHSKASQKRSCNTRAPVHDVPVTAYARGKESTFDRRRNGHGSCTFQTTFFFGRRYCPRPRPQHDLIENSINPNLLLDSQQRLSGTTVFMVRIFIWNLWWLSSSSSEMCASAVRYGGGGVLLLLNQKYAALSWQSGHKNISFFLYIYFISILN